MKIVENKKHFLHCDAASLDITPDDLCAGEDVTVTWYLSNQSSK